MKYNTALRALAPLLFALVALGGAMSAYAAPAYDPEFKYAELDTGIKLAYVELGNSGGHPVVFLHGVTDSYLSFSQVAPLVAAEGNRVIVVELRGHGHSDKPKDGPYTVDLHVSDIASLLSKLGIKNANITGHSLGSFIAQGLAARHPEYVSSLTLIGSAAAVKGNETLAWLLDGGDGFEGVNNAAALSDEFLTDWTASTNYDESFAPRTYEHAKSLPIEVWRNAVNGISAFTDELGKIQVPVQIIYGGDDAFFSRDDQADLIKRLGSKYILFQTKPGVGHNTHWEGHLDSEIASDIVSFIRAANEAQGK
ncbi:MAG: alpha/beta hydrolase [Synergistaceae bacterium]|jgi:pimeloyl-ACP methyl ester carboxylesterase|nr:alpha/beta hydrolase [Synergistaceae bacterium]